MSEHAHAERWRGVMARFAADSAIIEAARTLSGRGYRDFDAFVPRPIEALEDIIAPQRSTLPRTVFILAVLGTVGAFGLQWFCNGWLYPLNVGGRPVLSIPAFIPITFELMVLCGSLTAFFGVLWRLGLPRLVHPAFDVPDFSTVSIDQFWLYVSASDPRFDIDDVRSIMQASGCVTCSVVHEPGDELPATKPEPGPASPTTEGGPA
jgi:hypothetical protein